VSQTPAMSALLDHLYRRAGFGLTAADRQSLANRSYRDLVEALVVFDSNAADVDAFLGTPGYVGISTTGLFTPNTNISHARQRWLFRMVHSPAPLQEKMALVWHEHFATAFSKIAGLYNAVDATRLLAAKPSTDPVRQQGQIELFRQHGLGNFSDLLVQVAQDPAMLVWLDGETNTKTNPQENFGRELMELFTVGVQNYVETDVYAAARVFTGWNLQIAGTQGAGTAAFAFVYRPNQHETSAKTFSFPIYADGTTTIPARAASAGMQDGMDLIAALSTHPETARRLVTKLYTFFVCETATPDPNFISQLASTYLNNDTVIKPVLQQIFQSPQFQDRSVFYTRYSWPTEFVTRALKETGWSGFSAGSALSPLLNMGQDLFEPPMSPAGSWDRAGSRLVRCSLA
jgi:uncharacterized protein (DUF1800 family)